MISERELLDAIEQYENADNPTAQTCITLAAFYTVKDKLYPDVGESYSNSPSTYESDTEFWLASQKRDQDEVMGIIDELMETLKVLHPKLYEGVMRKITA